MGNVFAVWAGAWMPWKVSSAVEERLRFVARLIEGEAMTDLCQEFGVSRKTGYKIFNRYKEEGIQALDDRSRRPEVEYPLRDRDALVTLCGRICMHHKKINISNSLAGQRLGLKEGDDAIWLVSFMDYDLGDIGLEQKTLQPLDNPPRPLVSPMWPEHFVTHVFGMDPDFVGAARGTRTPDPLITNQVLYQLSYGGAGETGDSTARGALST